MYLRLPGYSRPTTRSCRTCRCTDRPDRRGGEPPCQRPPLKRAGDGSGLSSLLQSCLLSSRIPPGLPQRVKMKNGQQSDSDRVIWLLFTLEADWCRRNGKLRILYARANKGLKRAVLSLLHTLRTTRMHSQLESSFTPVPHPLDTRFTVGFFLPRVITGPGPAFPRPGIATFVNNRTFSSFRDKSPLLSLLDVFCHLLTFPRLRAGLLTRITHLFQNITGFGAKAGRPKVVILDESDRSPNRPYS